MSQDYYAILGVSKTATDAEIKSAYRKLAREWHPDVAKDKPDAESKFKEINEAYQVLGDPQKRKQYDQFGHSAYTQGRSGFGGAGGQGSNPFEGMGGFGPFTWSYQSSGGDGEDFQDPFDIFEQVFGFRGFGGSNKGRNLRYTMSIEFEDSIKGYEKTIEVNGHKLKVKLPPGVRDGMTVKFAGKGEKSQRGGPEGDLLISIHVPQHHKFVRQDDDIFTTESITFKQATLGDKVNIEVVDPKASSGYASKQLKIPEGTQPNTIFKLKGFGMPNPNGYGRGDHYVTINIEIPKSLNKQQKKALVEYF